jgi:hypothetical protein
MTRSSRLQAAATSALLCAGCIAPGNYASDRLLDLTDVLDTRGGPGVGLGLQVQATEYLQTGIGMSQQNGTAWYGRQSVDAPSPFFHLVVIGAEGIGVGCTSSDRPAMDLLGINSGALGESGEWTGNQAWFATGKGTPYLDRLRFGGTIYLPAFHVGLFLNLGEFVDFAGGIVALDLMNDDGLSKPPKPLEVQRRFPPPPSAPDATPPSTSSPSASTPSASTPPASD